MILFRPLPALFALILLCVPPTLFAADADLRPGEWEMTTTMQFEGLPLPPQTMSLRECLTAEDIANVWNVEDEYDECRVVQMDQRRDGLRAVMTCRGEDGGEAEIRAEMRFMGDRSAGTVEVNSATPMGPMTMRMEMEGRRIGDC
jgi:hypothetical protein